MGFGFWLFWNVIGLIFMLKYIVKGEAFKYDAKNFNTQFSMTIIEGIILLFFVVPPTSGIIGGVMMGWWILMKWMALNSCNQNREFSRLGIFFCFLHSLAFVAAVTAVYLGVFNGVL